jgi:surfeit locus 1 family protein
MTLPLLAVLIALGVWQLERKAWKETLIADFEARRQAQPVALPDPVGDPEALLFRPLRVEGTFLHEAELYIGARTYKGQSGYRVVTPLRLDDGRGLLVDRGWVPPEAKDPEARLAGLPSGRVTLVGLARQGGWHGSDWLRPANDPAGNLWLWVDLAAMSEAADLARPVTTIYLQALPGQHDGRYPIAVAGPVDLRDDHLQYAITWFALAAALLVIYLVYHLKPRGRPDAG